MVTGGGGGDSGREKLGWGLGKVEKVLEKVLAQGIEVWWLEEGDRRKGATAELVSDRWGKEEGGADDRAHNQINIWALLWRTVRNFLGVTPTTPDNQSISISTKKANQPGGQTSAIHPGLDSTKKFLTPFYLNKLNYSFLFLCFNLIRWRSLPT